MAFIPGRSLQQRIDHTGPLEIKEILRIGMQTALGLAAAHAKGLVHRDIKPANIMLENGVERVRITDFGLARAVDDASITQNGVLTGTPQYMAPEQARGEIVDQRADLFSLGSTLYAMCTGRSPFRADSTAAAVRQVCDTEPTTIQSINPDIPAWLEGIIKKLHAKDPDQRFQSAAEVADLLEQCLAHVQQPDQHRLPDLAKHLGRLVEAPKGSWRYRHWQAPLAAALMLCVLGAVAFILSWNARPGGATSRESDLVLKLDPGALEFIEEGLGSESSQLRNRMQVLEQSFRASPFEEQIGLHANLYDIRRQAESLERDLQSGPDPEADPLENQMLVIRRRLEQLKQNLGRPLE
jgi:serine/threonine-protein kinase